jgi:hypothetical protein
VSGAFQTVTGTRRAAWPPRGAARRTQVAAFAGLILLATSAQPQSPGDAPAAPPASRPKVAQASVAVEVPAGQHRNIRLKNLPRGVQIAMAAQSDGPARLWLLDEADFRRWPSPERPAAVVHVERVASASIGIPVAGDWYVVVDNSQGGETRRLKLVVGAAKGTQSPGGAGSPLRIEPEKRDF